MCSEALRILLKSEGTRQKESPRSPAYRKRDVLEALRILLKSEGYQTEGVTSLAGIFHALEKKEYALLLMDLNYTRDTTSGQEGLSAISKIQEIDIDAADRGDDGLGDH